MVSNKAQWLQLYHFIAHYIKLAKTKTSFYKNFTISVDWDIWMYDNAGPNQIYGALRHLDKVMGPFMVVADSGIICRLLQVKPFVWRHTSASIPTKMKTVSNCYYLDLM